MVFGFIMKILIETVRREVWLDTYTMEKPTSTNRVLCPKCGRYGFRTTRKAGKKYYPKYCTADAILLDLYDKAINMNPNSPEVPGYLSSIEHIKKKFKGSKYRGDEKKDLFDRQTCYHKLYRYRYDYIGHYDSEKYKKEMEDFKAGKRKSRPNGRKWCGPFRPQTHL
jgi:hypothetical protein